MCKDVFLSVISIMPRIAIFAEKIKL
jgi:hypothetical protein